MKFLLTDDEVSIPFEAVDYVNKRFEDSSTNPFKFEIIEAFFEWLSIQPITTQKRVLVKALKYGRIGAEIPSRFREKTD